MRRLVVLLTIAVPLALGASGAELKLPPEFHAILDLTASVPPEFAAHAILRMVSSGKIQDKETRRALCIRAFETAANAHERAMRQAIPGLGGDSAAASLDRAYRLRLDMVSLQSRAVTLLLHDDKGKARELFEQIPRPNIPVLTCADALAYDVSDYAAALHAIVESGFTPAERAKEDHVALILTYLSGITSPSQLVPAARLILDSSALTAPQRDLLINRFNGLMEGMSADPRAFAAAAPSLRAILTPAMQVSFEKLAARTRSAPACGDPNPQAPKVVVGAAAAPGLPMPDTQPFWQSNGSKAMLAQARKVRFGDNNRTWTDADRETLDWKDRYHEFIGTLASWNPDPDEPPAVYFHERVILYEGLMDVAPGAAARQSLLEDFISFLNSSSLQRDNPPEWFSVIPEMWHRIPFHDPAERQACADALARSGNPVVSLYLALEKTIPQGPGGQR